MKPNPDDYLPFLRQLLQLEINSNSDPKFVYPFLAQHTEKLNLTFAATAEQWFHSQLDPHNSQKNQHLARNFGNLANKFQQFPLDISEKELNCDIIANNCIFNLRS
jgi:hypothetical protein